METPEHLLNQLESLGSLEAIVKTMKALSAANIQQYEAAVESLKEYYRTVELGLQAVLRDYEQGGEPAVRGEQHSAAILFGSDLGLCGRFNEAIVRYALQGGSDSKIAAPDEALYAARHYLVVGSRAAGLLDDAGELVDEVFPLPGSAKGISTTVQPLLLTIDRWRLAGNVGRVDIFYNR